MKPWRSRGALSVVAVAAALACLACSASAQMPEGARSFSAAGLAQVGAYIRNEIASGKIPGAILLIQ